MSAAERSRPATLITVGEAACQTSGISSPLWAFTKSEKARTWSLASLVAPDS